RAAVPCPAGLLAADKGARKLFETAPLLIPRESTQLPAVGLSAGKPCRAEQQLVMESVDSRTGRDCALNPHVDHGTKTSLTYGSVDDALIRACVQEQVQRTLPIDRAGGGPFAVRYELRSAERRGRAESIHHSLGGRIEDVE